MNVGFFHSDGAAGVDNPHRRLASQMIRSVRRVMPEVPIVQWSDRCTTPIDGVDLVERVDDAPLAMMVLESYAAALDEWLLVDTDVVVQEDVRAVFDLQFDIAVADRAGTLLAKEVGTKFMARMPFNKGAVFSRSPAFWRRAVARLAQKTPQLKAWMGDQLVMNEVIREGGFHVEVLPARFNYPPRTKGEDVRRQAILHYKGPRKSWLLEAMP